MKNDDEFTSWILSKEAKKDYKKWLVKGIKNFLKKKKKSSENMVTNNMKIFLKIENNGWLSIE